MNIRKNNTHFRPQRAGGGIGIKPLGAWIAGLALSALLVSPPVLYGAVIDNFDGTEPAWNGWNAPAAPSDPAALAELANHRFHIATKFTTATDPAKPMDHFCNVYYDTDLPVQQGKTLQLRADLVSISAGNKLFASLATTDVNGGKYMLLWGQTEVALLKWSQSAGFSVAFWETHSIAYHDLILVLALTPKGDDLLVKSTANSRNGVAVYQRTVRDTPGSDWGVPDPLPLGWQIFGPDPGAAHKESVNVVALGMVHDTDGQQGTAIVQFDNLEYLSAVDLLEDTFVSVPIAFGGAMYSGEWMDMNNDGWPDLSAVVDKPDSSTSWQVLLNSRDGAFASAWEMDFSDNDRLKFFYRGYGDYDNDGLPDAAVGGDNELLYLYHNTGGGKLQWVWQGPPLYYHCEWVDLDQDGYLDLVQPHPWSSTTTVYLNDHNGPPFRLATKASDPGWALTKVAYSHYTAWGDYDDDGSIDVYVTGYATPGRLFRNLGAGEFVDTGFRGPASPSTDAEWVDYDGDNDLDLVVNYFFNHEFEVYRNEGDGRLVLMTAAEIGDLATDFAWHGMAMAWGDYDNDGDLDLYRIVGEGQTLFDWQQAPGRFYVNQGSGLFVRVMSGTLTTGYAAYHYTASWADYDNDGFLDLIGGRASPNESPIYRNTLPQNGNANHWLKVQCEGRVTNRDAVGAKVRVKASIGGQERWQLRQIVRPGCGGVLTAHFGLGDATKVDVLRVEWPSGVVQEYNNVAANESLTIKEPPRLVPTGPCAFEVKCWPGMHFTVQSSADLETWTAVGSVANVNGTATFSDVAGVEGTCRFYRVVDE